MIADSIVRQFRSIVGDDNAWTDATDLHTYAYNAAVVEAKGLFYPPDPGSQAESTIGGNVAENAGGLRGLKYGVTRDYVMGMSFFDVEGNLVKSGSRTVKCATGYNLTGLMVGSEGTLGVFAEIILKLIPLPAHRKAMMAVFDSMEKETSAGGVP